MTSPNLDLFDVSKHENTNHLFTTELNEIDILSTQNTAWTYL